MQNEKVKVKGECNMWQVITLWWPFHWLSAPGTVGTKMENGKSAKMQNEKVKVKGECNMRQA